jgi:hypothetical protein
VTWLFPFPTCHVQPRINIRLRKSDKIESYNGLFNPEAAHDYDGGMIHRSYSRSPNRTDARQLSGLPSFLARHRLVQSPVDRAVA